MELMDKDMFSFSIGGEKIGGDGAERGEEKRKWRSPVVYRLNFLQANIWHRLGYSNAPLLSSAPHPPTSLLLKRFRFLLLSKLVLRPPWQHDEMCLPHLFSFKTVVYENNVCSKRDGKSKQFAILIFLVQKFYLIKLRLPICVGVNICFKFPVSSTLPPHIIYSLENSDNIFLHLKKNMHHTLLLSK